MQLQRTSALKLVPAIVYEIFIFYQMIALQNIFNFF